MDKMEEIKIQIVDRALWSKKALALNLSYKDLELLRLVGMGFRNTEIAEILGIGYASEKNRSSRTCKKLGIRSTSHALAVAIQYGLLRIEPVQDDL